MLLLSSVVGKPKTSMLYMPWDSFGLKTALTSSFIDERSHTLAQFPLRTKRKGSSFARCHGVMAHAESIVAFLTARTCSLLFGRHVLFLTEIPQNLHEYLNNLVNAISISPSDESMLRNPQTLLDMALTSGDDDPAQAVEKVRMVAYRLL